MSDFFISPELAKHFSNDVDKVFEKVFTLEGEDYRLVKARRTFRFEIDGNGYFAKIHHGIGWKEIFKDLTQFKMPILGAENEYRAIRHLEEINVETMSCAAYGKRGKNPARQESFLITDELANMISLEDFVNAAGDMFGTIGEAIGNAAEVVADAAGVVVDILEHGSSL